jgi:hypothetical protein
VFAHKSVDRFAKTGSGQKQANALQKEDYTVFLQANVLIAGGGLNLDQARKRVFLPHSILKMHHFTKTGSGQT